MEWDSIRDSVGQVTAFATGGVVVIVEQLVDIASYQLELWAVAAVATVGVAVWTTATTPWAQEPWGLPRRVLGTDPDLLPSLAYHLVVLGGLFAVWWVLQESGVLLQVFGDFSLTHVLPLAVAVGFSFVALGNALTYVTRGSEG